MAVDAVYLFDEKQKIRRAIVWGIYELIHDEATYELDAEIDAKYNAKPGEYLGFYGIDNRFLLFEIDEAETDDKRGVLVITATYAPVKELSRQIVREIRLTGASVQDAGAAALDGSGWTLSKADAGGRTADLNKYYDTRWKTLKEISTQWQARVTPWYEFDGVQITRRYVDIEQRGNIFRGRLFEGASGTSQIYVTRSGTPVTRMYGLGKATGTEDPPTCVTIRDAVWSEANGDPADKPAGQDYIEDDEAIALYGEGREAVFQDKNIEDPAELLQATWSELQRLKRPTVKGTATASDVEHILGYEHMIVRMYDLVWVRTKHGEDVQAVVINVKRNYLRRGLTKITIGEETDDSGLIKKIAKLTSTSSALSKSSDSEKNRFLMTRQLIQLNADTIQMNARLIEANAEKIKLTASNLEKYEAGTDERLTTAELTLYGDGTSANAGLVARVEEDEEEISKAALTLYGDGTSANAGLVTEFDDLSTSYAQFVSNYEYAQAKIEARFETNEEQISEAALTLYGDGTSANAGLAATVKENTAAISATADELGSKVSIEALEIELNGYVTASQLDTRFTNFENGISDSLYVSALSANGFECSTFDFKGYGMSLKSTDYVKSVGRTKRYAMAPSGTTSMEFYEISSISNGTMYYMSWE